MKQPTLEDIDRAQVNMETAQIGWRELQPYFARGVTVAVDETLDLVDVAFQISKDNQAQVAEWMASGQISRVTDEQALAWYEADALLWAVVARPYVLVQDKNRDQ
ncbi:MAG: hypothetical protein FD121_236 [Gallionellaceae bacterium]|nr:MAG: hypothetical protein FD121_236 [Gallionellaceae bacterium]